MNRIHQDAVTVAVGIAVLAGLIWWLLATVNPMR